MAKTSKTVTVNQLHKKLGKLIEEGKGRVQVCVNKDTFHDNRESDGCVVLPVDGVRFEYVLQMDDDGFTATNKDGSEKSRATAVLYGTSATPYGRVLSSSFLDRYIANIDWDSNTSEDSKIIAAAAIRKFATELRLLVG